MEAGLGPDDTEWGPNSPMETGTAAPPPHFSADFALARSPISATAELLYRLSWQKNSKAEELTTRPLCTDLPHCR